MAKYNLYDALVGRTDSHTVPFQASQQRVHQEVVEPLEELAFEAKRNGFELVVCSGFRSFQRQLEIWNGKVTGRLPVLDLKGQPVKREGLSPEGLINSILRWSALPGASRHHWGTDFDVIDGSKVKEGMKVQLVPEEFEKGGPFFELHQWLDEEMADYGFFRPYDLERGGVSPERWHLSYAPLADQFLSKLSEELVAQTIGSSYLELKSEVLQLLPQIFKKYVRNVGVYSLNGLSKS